MTFKKGERVQTEDGQAGEILFIDKDGVEAQVALAHVSMKMRTDSLRKFESAIATKPVVRTAAAAVRPAKAKKAPRTPRK